MCVLREAMPAAETCPKNPDGCAPACDKALVKQIQARTPTKPASWRKKELLKRLGRMDVLSQGEKQELLSLLKDHHTVFVLEDVERGETGLVEMTIDTGDAEPRRCAPRRMPFAVRQEVAVQLRHMQSDSTIYQPMGKPSSLGSEKGRNTSFLY